MDNTRKEGNSYEKSFVKGICVSLASAMLFLAIGPSVVSAHSASKELPQQKVQTINPLKASTPINPPTLEKIEAQPYGIKTQAVKYALRHGGTALGKLPAKIPFKWAKKAGASIEKWGFKAANVVDDLTDFGEFTVTTTLVQAGIPPSDAALIAKFIVFFLG